MGKSIDKIKISTTKYIGKKIEADGTVTFKFQIPENLKWSEGTHFHLAFSDFIKDSKPDTDLVRSFSIMSMENERYIGFTTRVKDDCSLYKKRLMKLKTGDEMFIFKFRNNMKLKREGRPVVFISMGVGIATFRPLIKEFVRDSNEITKLTNINIDSSRSYVYNDEIKLILQDNFINHYVSSRKELYERIDECLSDSTNLYYIVGSDKFLRVIRAYLVEHSVDPSDITVDKKPEVLVDFFNEEQ